VAYATRYGKGCSLTEALELEVGDLHAYCAALDGIVRQEQRR
jgi:hypothetical protein